MLRLKEIRDKLNIQQKDVCASLCIPQNTYSQYENGKRQPDNETLVKIASFFNVTTDYLLGRTDEITPKPDNAELENDVIIYNRNGKIVKKKMSKEKMDMLASMIDAIPEDNNPDL